MAKILSYGCTSSLGSGVDLFWEGLTQGLDRSQKIETSKWPVRTPFRHESYLWPEVSGLSAVEVLVSQLMTAWSEARQKLDPQILDQPLGVILASTKGLIEDWVWENSQSLEKQNQDPLQPVLEKFLEQAGISPAESICISNACASSLVACSLALRWLKQKRVQNVLILSTDRVGPFVSLGFQALQALSSSRLRPFAQNRDGVKLGEAATAVVMTESDAAEIQIGTDTEGYAVTRPSLSGESLYRACLQIPGLLDEPPDLIVAHGTATRINDLIEDQVFYKLFGKSRIPITATKWCIGHTLAASGAMDLIAANEILKRQKAFKIANTELVDPEFHGFYLKQSQEEIPLGKIRRVLVTSLGFGGVHAAALLELRGAT